MQDSAAQHLNRMLKDLHDKGCAQTAAVMDAFACVPRHQFLPGVPLDVAYESEQAIGTHFGENGSCISSASAPTIMAVMLEQMSVRPGHNVLEIGAGTGYNAGLLAHLAGGGHVVSIDVNPAVAAEAVERLAGAGITGVDVLVGDGWFGAPGYGEFDRIVATVQTWDISPHWEQQLRRGGILVLPLWLRPGLHAAVAFEKTDGGLVSRSSAYCVFMPFRGPHAAPPCEAVVPHWRRVKATPHGESIAVFDDATPERVETLRQLLQGPMVTEPAPKLFPGWNVRLALEEPDVIFLMAKAARWNGSTGLFDSELRSLALVDGTALLGFGAPSCRERLEASLARAVPFDLESFRITAVPHGSSEGPDADVVLTRPHFDLKLEGLFR